MTLAAVVSAAVWLVVVIPAVRCGWRRDEFSRWLREERWDGWDE